MLGQQLTKEEVEDFMREADVVSDIMEVQNRNKWSQIWSSKTLANSSSVSEIVHLDIQWNILHYGLIFDF